MKALLALLCRLDGYAESLLRLPRALTQVVERDHIAAAALGTKLQRSAIVPLVCAVSVLFSLEWVMTAAAAFMVSVLATGVGA